LAKPESWKTWRNRWMEILWRRCVNTVPIWASQLTRIEILLILQMIYMQYWCCSLLQCITVMRFDKPRNLWKYVRKGKRVSSLLVAHGY
jgi:hypothetical protein